MRILIVDDHPIVRDGLRAAIQRFFPATLIVEAGSGYLLKTSAAQELRAAIRTVLQGQVYLCNDAAAALQQAERAGEPPSEPPGLSKLSRREQEVLQRIACGQTTKAIAADLQRNFQPILGPKSS